MILVIVKDKNTDSLHLSMCFTYKIKILISYRLIFNLHF